MTAELSFDQRNVTVKDFQSCRPATWLKDLRKCEWIGQSGKATAGGSRSGDLYHLFSPPSGRFRPLD